MVGPYTVFYYLSFNFYVVKMDIKMTQQNTMPELKPCPFCGSPARLVIGAPEYFVCCTSNCNPGRNLKETAINDWNTRTPDHTDLLKQEYERGKRDALWSIMEAKSERK